MSCACVRARACVHDRKGKEEGGGESEGEREQGADKKSQDTGHVSTKGSAERSWEPASHMCDSARVALE